mmetsp:Transcript_65186/g.172708  ORF Transcript_65186/g.172708 Transcript_65186/m.172708 type:complete len:206 (-) Transcript_65186:38-655(-)
MSAVGDSCADTRPSARFFLKGIAGIGEHHLKDYFDRFGDVVEVTLLRDKKTQRPRGLGFVSIAPRKSPLDDDAPSVESIVARLTEQEPNHTVNGIELELAEALPQRIEKEEEEQEVLVPNAGPAVLTGTSPAAASKPDPVAADPAALAAAAQMNAQWQMHYLAMAINVSVPDVTNISERPACTSKAASKGYGPAHGVVDSRAQPY